MVRAREQVRRDLLRARHRVSKLLLRNGRVWPAGDGTWTQAHRDWLSRQRFDEPDLDLVYPDLLATVDGLFARRDRARRAPLADRAAATLWPTVSRLRAFRGVDTITALGIHLELGDWTRFAHANDVGAYFGLVPSLDQSGEGSTSGAITKTGSHYARRLLVEAAWHYTRPPRIGVTLNAASSTARPRPPDRVARQHRLYRMHQQHARAREPATWRTSPAPASSPASSGPPPPRPNAAHTRPA